MAFAVNFFSRSVIMARNPGRTSCTDMKRGEGLQTDPIAQGNSSKSELIN
jgi:hypothetical protein